MMRSPHRGASRSQVDCSSERPVPVRSWRNLGAEARDSGQSRVPAPPAGITAQKSSTEEGVAGDASYMAPTVDHAGVPLPALRRLSRPLPPADATPSRHRTGTCRSPAAHARALGARDPRAVRIAIVTESFLPSLNGVTTSVCRVLEELRAEGHEAVVIAPDPAPPSHAGFRVHRVASVPVRSFRVGLPTAEIGEVLRAFGPDVVHLASPFVLGVRGLAAAQQLGIPSVAIYQTDMPSYLQQHSPGVAGRAASRAAWRWVRRIHGQADLTLAPSIPRWPTCATTASPGHGCGRGAWTRSCSTRAAGRRPPPARCAPGWGPVAGPSWGTSAGWHRRRRCTGWPS